MKQHEVYTALSCLILAVFLIGSGAMQGCGKPQPIKVGFAGCLTGRLSDLGIAGRNGVMLAVEQINQKGGVNGRPIELLIKDDGHDAEKALKVDKELIQEGVAAIIGHMTSSMTLKVAPLMNQEQMLLLSPTASTEKLSRRDDYFFRLMPPNNVTATRTAEYVNQKKHVQTVVCVYDRSNSSYTKGWSRNFTTTFEELGGRILAEIAFASKETPSYLSIAETVLREQAEAVAIIAGALDTAMLAQQIRKFNPDIPLIASGWAYTSELIQHGGSSVEGMILSHTFSADSAHPAFRRFCEQFRARFYTEPTFASAFAYEAAMLLFEALAENENPSELKQTILARKVFPGLQGTIEFDPYGENRRPPFLIHVRDGHFTIMEH